MVPPKNGVLRLWVPQLGQAAVAAADGLPEVLAVAAIPAATLDGLLAWFVVQSSRKVSSALPRSDCRFRSVKQ